MQLDMFDANDPYKAIEKEITDLKNKTEKTKKTHAKQYNELAAMYVALKQDHDELKLRVELLEKQLLTHPKHKENEDLVEKLFAEAYLQSTPYSSR
jgi:Tfp pilus assembly protein PilO